jgi:hypothetical protein
MSPAKKPGPRSPRKNHALRRHIPKAAPTLSPPSRDRPLVSHLIALDAAGWRVVEMRPEGTCYDAPLWRVAITRVDLDASISVWAAALDIALAELVRYASADADEPR